MPFTWVPVTVQGKFILLNLTDVVLCDLMVLIYHCLPAVLASWLELMPLPLSGISSFSFFLGHPGFELL